MLDRHRYIGKPERKTNPLIRYPEKILKAILRHPKLTAIAATSILAGFGPLVADMIDGQMSPGPENKQPTPVATPVQPETSTWRSLSSEERDNWRDWYAGILQRRDMDQEGIERTPAENLALSLEQQQFFRDKFGVEYDVFLATPQSYSQNPAACPQQEC